MAYNVSEMKLLISVGFVCLSLAAHASYDLMMVPDENSKGIARFDPVSRISLGAFAQNDSGRLIHSVNRAATTGQVFGTGSISSAFYDYSSGDVVGSTTIPTSLTVGNSTGTRFTETYFNNIYSYNQAAVVGSTIGTGLSTTYVSVPLSTSGFVAFGADAAGNFAAVVKNGAVSGTTTFGTGASSMLVGTPYVYSETVSLCSVYVPFKAANGTNYVGRYTVDISSGITYQGTLTTVNGFSTAACMTILPSHYGMYLVGRDSTTSSLTRITSYGLTPGLIFNHSYTTSSIQVPTSRWAGAVVLAPEPASYAVFLVGGFALLRRRRR